MAFPEQVRKQSEAVRKLYEDEVMGSGDQGSAGADADVDGPAPAASAPNPAPADQSSAPEPQQSPPEHKGDGTKSDEKTFEAKYKTLQGMYNAEVPRLHSTNKQLADRVAQLEQLISTMSTAQAQPANPAAEPAKSKLVTEQDVEDYGDSIDVMRRVSREEAAAQEARINSLEAMIRQMHTNVVPRVDAMAHRQAQTAEQQFWNELSNMVPNWQSINADEGFQNWLLEVDELSGISRQSYLEHAQRDLDTTRVANFFKAWTDKTGAGNAQRPRLPSSELERQVSPGRGKSGGSAASVTPKTYTRAEIAKFFGDVSRGIYAGKETERNQIERDIFAAQSEGRIV